MSPRAFRLFNDTTPWLDPPNPGQYFVRPILAEGDAAVNAAKSEFDSKKEHHDNFRNLITALRAMFEEIIDQAYHSAGMGRRGFGNELPPAILFRLQAQYGRPTIMETDAALKRLHEPMDRNKPIEVMLRVIEEVQLFLLSHPEPGQELPDNALIRSALSKLHNTGCTPSS